MRSDDARVDELEAVAASHRARLENTRRDGSPFLDASEAAKISNALTQIHHELTAIEHLKLQRAKAAAALADSPAADEEVEVAAVEYLRARGKKVG